MGILLPLLPSLLPPLPTSSTRGRLHLPLVVLPSSASALLALMETSTVAVTAVATGTARGKLILSSPTVMAADTAMAVDTDMAPGATAMARGLLSPVMATGATDTAGTTATEATA